MKKKSTAPAFVSNKKNQSQGRGLGHTTLKYQRALLICLYRTPKEVEESACRKGAEANGGGMEKITEQSQLHQKERGCRKTA